MTERVGDFKKPKEVVLTVPASDVEYSKESGTYVLKGKSALAFREILKNQPWVENIELKIIEG